MVRDSRFLTGVAAASAGNRFTLLLVDYLRAEARWRRKTALRYDDYRSDQQADALDAAARDREGMDDSDRLIEMAVERGMFNRGKFSPTPGVAEIVRQHGRDSEWRRPSRPVELWLKMFAVCLPDAELDVWANRVQGLCKKFSYRLIAVNRTRLPRFMAYKVVDSTGIHVLGDDTEPKNLGEIERFLNEGRQQ